MSKPITTRTFRRMKAEGRKIVVLTAYDWMLARYLDEAGVDAILVGDSAGQVFAGHRTTLPVTLDDMIYHARAVRRGAPDRFLIVDMPFLSFQVSPEDTLRNAGRVMKETDAQAVKVEGGASLAPTVERLVGCGIPVMGHLGLTPQSVHAFGGYGLRASEAGEADRLRSDARALERAGCFSIVLEKIPRVLAAEVSTDLEIPTIGIGAGPGTDGQVLVTPDLLGLTPDFRPRFVRRYADLDRVVRDGLRRFAAEVRDGAFPGDEESYP
ncbi:MAG TPA: 3-methyl-2-oxobutanoate hydroxymethyltransferase, partial [Gemmatimonadota bacterium]|nr:3-methyl-2-oxobutanoate hydroxymethyltransferase [Gemmatimonadota bacterium]